LKIKYLENKLASLHRAIFDNQILENECSKLSDKKWKQAITENIQIYEELIKNYEDGIVTLKNREGFKI